MTGCTHLHSFLLCICVTCFELFCWINGRCSMCFFGCIERKHVPVPHKLSCEPYYRQLSCFSLAAQHPQQLNIYCLTTRCLGAAPFIGYSVPVATIGPVLLPRMYGCIHFRAGPYSTHGALQTRVSIVCVCPGPGQPSITVVAGRPQLYRRLHSACYYL